MKKLTITLALALCLCGSALAELDTMPAGWDRETSFHGPNDDSTSESIIETQPEGYGLEDSMHEPGSGGLNQIFKALYELLLF